MRDRTLAIAWVVAAVLLLLLLGYELNKWRALTSEGQRAAQQRQRLTEAIRSAEEQIVGEMRANTALLQEMQWTSSGGDPSAFLNRIAELVREKRLRVLGIGSLERQATPQFNKSWHTIQIVVPYRELRELAGRVESEKGILEDMKLLLPSDGARATTPRDELQASFKMTALELTAEAKRILDRALTAAGSAASAPAASPLALSVPSKLGEAVPPGRDPFQFGAALVTAAVPTRGPRPAGTVPGAPAGEPKPEVAMDVSGVVAFPGGFLAIVNNQIVKVGDTVSGHRVEQISDSGVTLRAPGSTPRTIPLKDLATAPAAGPRR